MVCFGWSLSCFLHLESIYYLQNVCTQWHYIKQTGYYSVPWSHSLNHVNQEASQYGIYKTCSEKNKSAVVSNQNCAALSQIRGNGCNALHCAFYSKPSIYLVEIQIVLLWCQFFGFGSTSEVPLHKRTTTRNECKCWHHLTSRDYMFTEEVIW